ncbi:hypothetical protein ADA01nite_35860 [Aneurinibacillus danicus]|nr:hypothetical protein ADA01nite_35860 [Aneurinibacillus danicus]
MKWYEIFRSGRYEPQGQFTEDDLQQIADNYERDGAAAPIVIGHPKEEQHAYGWVTGVKRVGNKLLASFKDVVPEFAAAVNAGRYKKVSVRLRNTGNGWTLRHVGFLGAAAPAVEGLPPIEFVGNNGAYIELDFSGEERTETGMTHEDWNRRIRQALQREREIVAFVARHEAKLPPAMRKGLAEFMAELSDEQTVEFSEDGERKRLSPYSFFKQFVTELSERGASFSEDAGKSVFQLSANDRIDSERLEIDRKARDFAAQHQCSYEDAVFAVLRT